MGYRIRFKRVDENNRFKPRSGYFGATAFDKLWKAKQWLAYRGYSECDGDSTFVRRDRNMVTTAVIEEVEE